MKIQCLETFEVMIIINHKRLNTAPGIAPEELSEHLRCVTSHFEYDLPQADAVPWHVPWYLKHFHCMFLSSSLQLFLSLHYPQAKFLNLLPHSINLAHGIILIKKMQRYKKLRNPSLVTQNKTPFYFQLHPRRGISRGKF